MLSGYTMTCSQSHGHGTGCLSLLAWAVAHARTGRSADRAFGKAFWFAGRRFSRKSLGARDVSIAWDCGAIHSRPICTFRGGKRTREVTENRWEASVLG